MWVRALNKLDPAIFDFVGGEPLVFRDFTDLLIGLDGKHGFAVTSNLHGLEQLRDFVARAPKGQCAHFTGSYHPSGRLDVDEFAYRLGLVRDRGISTSVNIIRHESIPNADELAEELRGKGFTVHVSPYEHPPNLETPNVELLKCQAGLTHYVINNNGDVYPCLSWFRFSKRHRRNIGNIFKNTFKKIPEPACCNLRCEMFYVVDPNNSMVQDLHINRVVN